MYLLDFFVEKFFIIIPFFNKLFEEDLVLSFVGTSHRGGGVCTLYVDTFLTTNFLMDYLVIWLFKRILQLRHNGVKSVAFAGILSLLPLLEIYLKLEGYICFLLETFVVVAGVYQLTYRAYKKLLLNVMLFINIFILLGGLGTLLYENTVIGYLMQKMYILFLVILISGGIIVGEIIISFREKNRVYKDNIWDIEFENEFCTYKGRGLFDSGNTLIDPVFKKGISIVEIKRLKINAQLRFHYVPYNSLGNAHGLIKVMKVDFMKLMKDKETIILREVLVGIYEGELSSDDYSMILNSTILDGRDNDDN